MNIKSNAFEYQASKVLAVLGNPFRVRLVMTLWAQEACVCHLELLLKKRQAYISQHLMALREIDLLDTRREGKFIYYRIANEDIINLIKNAGLIAGYPQEDLPRRQDIKVLDKCICPHCEGEGSAENALQPATNVMEKNTKI